MMLSVRRVSVSIFAVVSAFTTTLIGCVGGAQPPKGAPLSVARIFSSDEFQDKDFGPARWLDDGSGYTTLEPAEAPGESEPEGEDIVKYDPETGKRDILVAASRLIPPGSTQPLKIEDYAWSADGGKVLIFTNTKRLWRKNTRGDYWVLDRSTGKLQKLGGDADPSHLMFAKFSPDATRVAYVYKKNLYVQDLHTLAVTGLTGDGGDRFINGTSDWVYEEEFSLRDGFRWSPDGKRIAYFRFDTEGVKAFALINNTDGLYPKITRFRYPKAGETNSACTVGVVSAAGGETQWLDIPGDPRNHYIPKMDWAESATEIVLQQLNRLQNTNRIMLCDVAGDDVGTAKTVFVDRDDAWVDIHDDQKWVANGKKFSWTSERDGWRHLYLVSRDGRETTLLTPGAFDVIRVEAVDDAGGWAYYTAAIDEPTRRYLYRVPLDGSAEAERLTPEALPGTHDYQLSKGAKWAFHTYSAFGKPPVIDLVRLPEHTSVRVLEDNAALQEKVNGLFPCPSGFFRLDIGDGVLLDAWFIKPPDFDPSRKYPLLFYVYGEPAGQTVLDRWGGNGYLWHRMLAEQGYIVVSVDNRGTPAPRGRAWRKCIYRQVGILASADQAAATRALIKNWPYVDPNRIGIWGWSGGGSMSLNAIFRYPELYHTAMAVAFVSNQRFYDTIYQERYMELPRDNEEGYKNGSPITFAHQLAGHLLLVYGTGDDNCHYQNCDALVDELVKHNKQFSMMAYPNRSHSLKEGENTHRHLYELLTRYLIENLPPGPSPAGR